MIREILIEEGLSMDNLLNKYPTITQDTIISVLPNNDISISQLSKNTHFKLTYDGWVVLKQCQGSKNILELFDELNKDFEIELQELTNFLIDAEKRGYISFNIISEKHTINIKGDGKIFFPNAVSILLTNKCNLRCEYCYGDYSSIKNEFLPIDKVPELFDILEKNGITAIELSGGEPLLHPHFNEILKLACNKKWHINILSNGVLFDDEIFQIISDNKRWICLQISIDGSNEIINEKVRNVKKSFSKTLYTIRQLQGMDCRIKVVIVLTPNNKDDLRNTCELMRKIGIKNFSISIADSIGRGATLNNPDGSAFNNMHSMYYCELAEKVTKVNEEYSDIIYGVDKFKKNFTGDLHKLGNCGAGWRIVTILPNGDVKGCQLLPTEVARLGNVFTNDFLEIFNGREINQFYQTFLKAEDEILCQGCEYIHYCAKCCTKVYLANKKRLSEGKDFCDFAKKIKMHEALNFNANISYTI